MDDADKSAPGGGSVPPLGHPHTHALRLHGGGRGFVALCTQFGADWSERFAEPPGVFVDLPPLGSMGEHFISVNAFRRPGRTIANLFGLRACFLDLDYHRAPAWRGVPPENVWHAVQGPLRENAISIPTMVVASGRGLHLYWNFPRGLPREALSRWRAVQQHLCKLLASFGADRGAIDAARVLRIAGTLNPAAGAIAHFVHLDMERDVDFEDLAGPVLPFTQWELQQLGEQRAVQAAEAEARDPGRSSRAQAAYRAFVDTVIADIDRLIAHRWGRIIPEGHRNTTLFVRGCFMVRRVGIFRLESALAEYGRATCDLDADEIDQVAGSIAKKVTEDGKGYRYSTVGAADALQVTVDEVRAAGLVRLHPADPQLQAERRAERLRQDRERKAALRRAAGILPRSERPKRGEPWKALGISRPTWYRKYYAKS